MNYKEYRAAADCIRSEKELKDFINAIEDDFESITARQYHNLRRVAIDTYYRNLED